MVNTGKQKIQKQLLFWLMEWANTKDATSM